MGTVFEDACAASSAGCDDTYGGTFRIMDKVYRHHGIEMTFIDLGDLKKAEAAFKPNTKLLPN